MPFGDHLRMQDMSRNNMNNQVVPFMLSSEGRYIWAEKPFCFEVKDGQLIIYSDSEKIEPVKAGNTLKEALLAETLSTFGTDTGTCFLFSSTV